VESTPASPRTWERARRLHRILRADRATAGDASMLRINCDDTAATLRSRRGKALGPGFVVSQEHTNFLIFTMPAVM
jgi:hypothetical protein